MTLFRGMRVCFVLISETPECNFVLFQCPLRLTGTNGVLDGHVMISDQLRRQLAIDVTGRVVLTSLSPHMTSAHFRSVSLHPLFQTVCDMTELNII